MSMKAIVYTEFGSPDVLHVTQMEKPTPKDDEILIRIEARSVNYGDLLARNFAGAPLSSFNMPFILYIPSRLVFGLRKPRINILGSEYAGVVESVGQAVTKFSVGDKVFGYQGQSMGANAEYMTIAENKPVTHMPQNLSFEEAAVLPYGGLTALSLLKTVNIQPGQKVLINGASGGIGAAAVQLAKHYGAEVTGVAGTRRQQYMRDLGADYVVDYSREDFTTSGKTYDVIFDILGKSSFRKVKQALTPQGRYLRASFKMREVYQALWASLRGGKGKRVVVALASESQDALVHIRELAEAGVLHPLIDRRFSMENAADAHRYVENGSKQGSVVIVTEPERVASFA